HRSRAQHRLSSQELNSSINAVGDHLPPLDPSQEAINSSHNEYNTEERIRAIKKFVQLNKKRRNKMELKLKRMILEQEIDRMGSYEELREKLEESMAEVYKDVQTVEETSDDEFTPIN